MSKTHRPQQRKKKKVRSSSRTRPASGNQPGRWLTAVLASCATAAVLLAILQPWKGGQKPQGSQSAADSRDSRQKAWGSLTPQAGRAPSQTPAAATKGQILPMLLHESPSSLTAEQESASLKKEESKLAEEVGADFPDTADYLVLEGDMHARHGDSAKAMELWNKSLELEPRRADVYAKMGHVAREREEPENAIEYWRKALEIRPEMRVLRDEIAQAQVEMGKYQEAIDELEKDRAVSLRLPHARLMLGEAYMYLNQLEQAKEHYEAAVQLDPNYTNAYHGLFTVCNRLKLHDKAREYLARFKELKAKDDENYTSGRIDVRFDINRMRDGLLEAYLQAEQMYQAKGNLAKAEILLHRAIRLKPADARPIEKLAILYFQTNHMPESLDLYKRLQEIAPETPRYQLNIGLISGRLGLADDAEAAYRKATGLAPDDPTAHRELARLYLQNRKNLTAAMDQAATALRLSQSAENYFVYSWASDVNGNHAEALRAIERATKMEPANQTYSRAYALIKSRK